MYYSNYLQLVVSQISINISININHKPLGILYLVPGIPGIQATLRYTHKHAGCWKLHNTALAHNNNDKTRETKKKESINRTVDMRASLPTLHTSCSSVEYLFLKLETRVPKRGFFLNLSYVCTYLLLVSS